MIYILYIYAHVYNHNIYQLYQLQSVKYGRISFGSNTDIVLKVKPLVKGRLNTCNVMAMLKVGPSDHPLP